MKNIPFSLDGITDTAVLAALATVQRHLFVPPGFRDQAYENRPLPIGHQQTISQPYIVACMSEVLQLEPKHRVLEIGTGSGYQAAVLSTLVESVYSVEIIESLGIEAETRLRSLGYDNVRIRIGNGRHGWPEHAPFDRIMVTAAAVRIPEALIDQLAPGGRLVIPVGLPEAVQSLILATKTGEGNITTRRLLSVRFVPMTGE